MRVNDDPAGGDSGISPFPLCIFFRLILRRTGAGDKIRDSKSRGESMKQYVMGNGAIALGALAAGVRLGGNAVADIVIFGRIAAESAMAYLGD